MTQDRVPTMRQEETGPQTVSSAESSAPSADEGVSCFNKSRVLVTVNELAGSPTYTLEAWVKTVGGGWALVQDGTFAGLTTTWAQIFNVAGAERFFLRVSALTGGGDTVARTYVTTAGG